MYIKLITMRTCRAMEEGEKRERKNCSHQSIAVGWLVGFVERVCRGSLAPRGRWIEV
jgi:hypothetical protein